MEEKVETKESPIQDIGFCRHDSGLYSLRLNFHDTMINLSSAPWSHRSGNSTTVSIFSLTEEDILLLATRIQEAAFKIKNNLV